MLEFDNLKDDLFEEFKLNHDWGYGRFDFIHKNTFGEKVFASWVGVPPVGLHPCNFFPYEERCSPEQLENWKKAKEDLREGCH